MVRIPSSTAFAGRSRRRWSPPGVPAWRFAGAVLIVGGLVVAGRWAPAAAPSWGVVERFGFDDAACEERLAAREVAPFEVPAGRSEPLSATELAGWFRLDAEAVCAANRVPAGACGDHAFSPGEVAALPLGRGATEPAAPAAAEP